jgi:hypothetical protein
VKRILVVTAIVALVLAFSVSPVAADSYAGTPSPSLDPVFGTLVDFDDQATGTEVSWDDYVGLGVASITETEGVGVLSRYFSSQSQPNYVGTGSTSGWEGTILIELMVPTNMIGIGIAKSTVGAEALNIYDVDHNLLETTTAPIGENDVYVYFERSDNDIKFLEIIGDYFAIDDLQFNRFDDLPFTDDIEAIDDYIQDLPDEIFRNNPDQRKNALSEKLNEVLDLIETERYQEAIDKLQHDIRVKADGSLGGNPKNDWITDPAAQLELSAMIDDLIAQLQT